LNGVIIDERAEAADCLSEKPVPTLSDRELFRPTTSVGPATGGRQAAPIYSPPGCKLGGRHSDLVAGPPAQVGGACGKAGCAVCWHMALTELPPGLPPRQINVVVFRFRPSI
jgi:hypothetical protein